jgi:hypothetical protein
MLWHHALSLLLLRPVLQLPPVGVLLQFGAAAPLCDSNCAADVRPVCGADGRSYSNGCVAFCAGVTVASEGYCAGQEAFASASAALSQHIASCVVHLLSSVCTALAVRTQRGSHHTHAPMCHCATPTTTLLTSPSVRICRAAQQQAHCCTAADDCRSQHTTMLAFCIDVMPCRRQNLFQDSRRQQQQHCAQWCPEAPCARTNHSHSCICAQ